MTPVLANSAGQLPRVLCNCHSRASGSYRERVPLDPTCETVRADSIVKAGRWWLQILHSGPGENWADVSRAHRRKEIYFWGGKRGEGKQGVSALAKPRRAAAAITNRCSATVRNPQTLKQKYRGRGPRWSRDQSQEGQGWRTKRRNSWRREELGGREMC